MALLTEQLIKSRTRCLDLSNVRKLNCWGSNLTDITAISKLKNAQILSLSMNNVTSLKAFKKCKHLEELYIRKNKISNIKEICYLKELKKLRILWLSDNPCTEFESYRATVLRNLPYIVKLDNMPITNEERKEAEEIGCILKLDDDEEEDDSEETNDEDDSDENLSENEADVEDSNNSNSEEPESPEISHTINTSLNNNNISKPKLTISSDDDVLFKRTNNSYIRDLRSKSESSNGTEVLELEETNKLRIQLGLQPLYLNCDKVRDKTENENMPPSKNNNVVQACLLLINSLEKPDLIFLKNAIDSRLNKL